MGNVVFLHVSRPDVVRDINLCVSLDLGKSSYLKATHEPLFGRGILKSNGEAWAHQRKIIAPEFFLNKVKVPYSIFRYSSCSKSRPFQYQFAEKEMND